MDFTFIKFSSQSSFTVKKGTIDKLQFLLKTTGIYQWQRSMIISTTKLSRDMRCGMSDQQRLRPACAYAQSDQSLCTSLEYSMSVKLLTENHLEFLSLKRGCATSYESTNFKMPHCWKSRVAAQFFNLFVLIESFWFSK